MFDWKINISLILFLTFLSWSCHSDCGVCCCFLRSRNMEAAVDSGFSLIMRFSVWVKLDVRWVGWGGGQSGKEKGWKAWHCTIVTEKNLQPRKWKECKIVSASTNLLLLYWNFSHRSNNTFPLRSVFSVCTVDFLSGSWWIQHLYNFCSRKRGNVDLTSSLRIVEMWHHAPQLKFSFLLPRTRLLKRFFLSESALPGNIKVKQM